MPEEISFKFSLFICHKKYKREKKKKIFVSWKYSVHFCLKSGACKIIEKERKQTNRTDNFIKENQKSKCSGNICFFFRFYVFLISRNPLQEIKNNSRFKLQKGIFDLNSIWTGFWRYIIH